MSSRIPPLLESYLTLPPKASLILLTSVLQASSNWLVLRFLYSVLQTPAPVIPLEDDARVLLVSFVRDYAFWKENARRLGLDLDKLAVKKRFNFMDGLSGLFFPNQKSDPKAGENVLLDSSLSNVSRAILQGIKSIQGDGGKVILVIDQMDLLLAAGGDPVTVIGMGDMLMGLRERVYCTVMTISADYPLVAAHQTALETNHAAFLLSTSHQADFTMGLRLLDSGTARDVSGVLRITVGDQVAEEGQNIQRRLEEKELLYFVGGDGGVKVFERGQ